MRPGAGPRCASYRTVAEMLKRRLENAPLLDALFASSPATTHHAPLSDLTHDNVRGGDYFDKEETQ